MNKHEKVAGSAWGRDERKPVLCVCVMGDVYRPTEDFLFPQQGCIAFNWSTCGTITSFTQTRY